MVSQRVVNLHAQILFGLPIQVKCTRCPRTPKLQRIEDMVPTLDDKIALDRARFLEALIATLCGVQFRFQMRVGDKEKGKILRRRR